jgi:ribosomal protein S18 acetylase RimI-like enzyme
VNIDPLLVIGGPMKAVFRRIILLSQSVRFCRTFVKSILQNAFEYRQVMDEEGRNKLVYLHNPENTAEDQDYQAAFNPSDSPFYSFKALFRNRITGAVTLSENEFHDNYPGWWLSGLEVYWPFRRLGIAKRLNQEVFAFALRNRIEELYITVWDKNAPACNLFEELGFAKIGERLQSIPDEKENRTYIVMRKDLS